MFVFKSNHEYGYKNLSTSRGDGNYSQATGIKPFVLYKNLSTSRGDGNLLYLPNYHKFLLTSRYKNLSTSRGAGNRL